MMARVDPENVDLGGGVGGCLIIYILYYVYFVLWTSFYHCASGFTTGWLVLQLFQPLLYTSEKDC